MKMEGVVGQKRSRDEPLDLPVDEATSKKLCDGSGSSGLSRLTFEQEDALPTLVAPCVSSTDELPSKVVNIAGDDGGAESKAILEETLRSLEEELGVSGDSADFSIPSSAVEELQSSALENWGHDIWNVQEFTSGSDNGLLAAGEVGCSSESSVTLSGTVSSRSSPGLVDGDVCDTTARINSSDNNDHFDAVDIGFLREASDDELGIPPSPTSEREQSSENEQAGQHSSLEIGTADSLEDVSWALEGRDDNMGFSDSGIEEWMVGNLDFMMDSPVIAYAAVSPLVEAGVAL